MYDVKVSSLVPTHLWEYIVASTIIIMVPGPSVLFTVARAISWGRLTAIATVIGNALGMLVIAILVAVGLGPILQTYRVAYIGVQWFGGAYLIYLGIDAIRYALHHAQGMAVVTEAKPSMLKTIREGFTVGALNPKSAVFFAAIIPQFTDRSSGHLVAQFIFLSFIFVIIAIISDSAWGILAGTLREWLATDIKRLVRMRITGGIVMIVLGIFTLANSLRA